MNTTKIYTDISSIIPLMSVKIMPVTSNPGFAPGFTGLFSTHRAMAKGKTTIAINASIEYMR